MTHWSARIGWGGWLVLALLALLGASLTARPAVAQAVAATSGVLSAGGLHTCALTQFDAVCWGSNGQRQATGQSGPFTAISAGGLHSCALTPQGAVGCWGSNGYGQATLQYGPFGPKVSSITVSGKAQPVGSGDTSPSLHDDTFFGATPPGTSTERTFSIANTGQAPLTLLGTQPIRISGTHAAAFVLLAPPASVVAPGASTSFTLRFQPAAAGLHRAVVTIASDAANMPQHTFEVAAREGATAVFLPLSGR